MTGFGIAITVSYHFWESWLFRMGWMCSTIGCRWSEQWGRSGFRFCVQEMFFCWSLTWGAVHALRILVMSLCREETLLKRWVYMCTSNWIHINMYYTFRIWEDVAHLRKGWKRIKFMIRKSYPTHYTPWSFPYHFGMSSRKVDSINNTDTIPYERSIQQCSVTL